MSNPPVWTSALAAQAARARIAEIGARMSTQQTSTDQAAGGAGAAADRDLKAATRAMWAAGDYHRFATGTVWQLGPRLVAACGISPGQRVLDVACGSGNVAIRAAEVGAEVVASDLTPENFAAGRREAEAAGVEVEWVEADVEALPFDDGEFDVVTSLFGAIFAPHHQRVADELLRVCRGGGTVGLLAFTPDGLGGEFFGLFGRHAPPLPPGAQPPLLWGQQDHVRGLFGDRVEHLEMTRGSYVEPAPDPKAYRDFFYETFGPLVALRAGLADDPDRLAALDDDFADYVERCNSGPEGGPAEYRYDYLRVIARKRAGGNHGQG